MGNASEIEPARIEGDFVRVLAGGERIEKAYQLLWDLFVFTNKRLILVDKQGLTGSKVEYRSLPYRSITHFSVRPRATSTSARSLRSGSRAAPFPSSSASTSS